MIVAVAVVTMRRMKRELELHLFNFLFDDVETEGAALIKGEDKALEKSPEGCVVGLSSTQELKLTAVVVEGSSSMKTVIGGDEAIAKGGE